MSNKPTEAENAKHLAILQQLLKLPENQECADCTCRAPRWASINLGVFICIRCSGLHRSLGVHITKVRSTTLDSWTRDQVDTMVRIGNARSNAHYLARFDKLKPAESTDDRSMEQHLREKYERKSWAAPGKVVDSASDQSGGATAAHHDRPRKKKSSADHHHAPVSSSGSFSSVSSSSSTVSAPVVNNGSGFDLDLLSPLPVAKQVVTPSADLMSFGSGPISAPTAPAPGKSSASSSASYLGVAAATSAPVRRDDTFDLLSFSAAPAAAPAPQSGGAGMGLPQGTNEVKANIMAMYNSAPAAHPGGHGMMGGGAPMMMMGGGAAQNTAYMYQNHQNMYGMQPQQAPMMGMGMGMGMNMGMNMGMGAPMMMGGPVASTGYPAMGGGAPQMPSAGAGGGGYQQSYPGAMNNNWNRR